MGVHSARPWIGANDALDTRRVFAVGLTWFADDFVGYCLGENKNNANNALEKLSTAPDLINRSIDPTLIRR